MRIRDPVLLTGTSLKPESLKNAVLTDEPRNKPIVTYVTIQASNTKVSNDLHLSIVHLKHVRF